MKKILAILLIFSLFVQIAGYSLLFRLRQAEIRMEVQSSLHKQIRSGDLLEFVFSQNPVQGESQPEWEGHDEFRLHGEMYDVIATDARDGKIHVQCILDKKENRFLSFTRELGKKQSHQKTTLLFKILTALYTTGHEPALDFPEQRFGRLFLNYTDKLLTRSADILKPPPALV